MRKATITGAIVAAVLTLIPFTNVHAQAFTENFDNITLLAGNGWVQSNVSTPIGVTNWSQGPSVGGGGPFDAYNGAADAFISANFNNTTGGTGTISNWLVTPTRTFKNGDVISFFTRKATPDTYPDRLEVRLSTNGASSNVGSGASVGDFTTLLLSVNPTLVTGVYPTTWTQYTITISGLAAPTSGRIGFRYYVTNAGPTGTNSDFIGMDNIVYIPYVCPTFTLTAAGPLVSGTAGSFYSTSLTQSGALGTPTFAVTAGALPPGLTLSSAGVISGTSTATGTFNFTVTVSDASGCSGSQSYSILIGCPANPTSLNGLPTLCDNSGIYTLTQGSPAGGTYSGNGISGSTFDPSIGSEMITYNYTDIYGCAHSSSNPITVNTAPSVSHSPIAPVCDNSGLLALTGGSPAGGTYSGNGISGSTFDPSIGSEMIVYSYTDANGCSNTASTPIMVNTAPSVSHTPIAAVCDNSGLLTLSGGSPAGGTYSGNGISGSTFDPSIGSEMIVYTYTDANGCSNTASTPITVNTAPSVSHSPIAAVCDNSGLLTLSGGSPAGGTYSGNGISGSTFDPSIGSEMIVYSYTDANGCSNTASTPITVNPSPSVNLTLSITSLCVYNNAVTLSGGTPVSGSYSGTGVAAGSFDPATAGLGTHTITYDYTDANGCAASATDNLLVDACLGITEVAAGNLVVYPNPSNGLFTVVLETAHQLTDLKVVDLQGKMVNAEMVIQGTTISIDVTKTTDGIYLLQGISNGELITVRLVKN